MMGDLYMEMDRNGLHSQARKRKNTKRRWKLQSVIPKRPNNLWDRILFMRSNIK